MIERIQFKVGRAKLYNSVQLMIYILCILVALGAFIYRARHSLFECYIKFRVAQLYREEETLRRSEMRDILSRNIDSALLVVDEARGGVIDATEVCQFLARQKMLMLPKVADLLGTSPETRATLHIKFARPFENTFAILHHDDRVEYSINSGMGRYTCS